MRIRRVELHGHPLDLELHLVVLHLEFRNFRARQVWRGIRAIHNLRRENSEPSLHLPLLLAKLGHMKPVGLGLVEVEQQDRGSNAGDEQEEVDRSPVAMIQRVSL